MSLVNWLPFSFFSPCLPDKGTEASWGIKDFTQGICSRGHLFLPSLWLTFSAVSYVYYLINSFSYSFFKLLLKISLPVVLIKEIKANLIIVVILLIRSAILRVGNPAVMSFPGNPFQEIQGIWIKFDNICWHY